ncbi:MAG: NUDIX domain-containing protein [Clostridia bacterium]|nr:NUDIX domain-containing protein [Clostridia bacterium]
MITEKWDILDREGTPTGKTTVRGKCFLKQGEYHLVVHIWVVSKDGKYLIQRRSDTKKVMSGEWAATGGAAISGEDSYQAASRELFEELGILMNRDNVKKAFRIRRKNSLVDVWMTVSDKREDELVLQESEVADAKWVTAATLRQMIADGKFHNYGKEYFDLMFSETNKFRGNLV